MNTTVALPAVVADQLTEVLHSLDAMHTLAQLATGEDRVMAGTFAVALAEMAEVNGNRIQACIDSLSGKDSPTPD